MTEVKRDTWGHKIEFMLASIGWAVGYGEMRFWRKPKKASKGNVWRFPYKCFEHGGGAFLIPYVICLVFAGVPSYALECCLGQFSRSGPNQAFAQLAPIFHGRVKHLQCFILFGSQASAGRPLLSLYWFASTLTC